jgi:hypothetical protein
MSLCPPGYREVAAALDGGLDCSSASPLFSLHRPWDLTNWTLPVVELLMVAGAVAALVHAVLWWRRRGDPTNLGLWFASVVYVIVLEPPLYFPDTFGLQDQVGLIFVHNQFSVQFLYDRLPLYILALYPALTYLIFVLVRATGVLDRGRPWVGAACVAITFHCFYEIFDQLGPQLQWWGWNPAAPSNSPLLASVPLSSAAIFAGASPFGFALLTQLLISRRAARGAIPWYSMLVRVVAVGSLTPLFMVAFAIPYGIASAGEQPDSTVQALALWAVIVSLAAVAVYGFWSGAAVQAADAGRFSAVGAAIYLLVFAILWATALPDYLQATNGRTAIGAPTGDLGYVLLCAAAGLAVLVLAARRAGGASRVEDPAGRLAGSVR